MLAFATEFPLNTRHRAPDLVGAIRDWVLGSPHTAFAREELQGVDQAGEWRRAKPGEVLQGLSFSSDALDAAALKYTRTDSRLEWATTIVFSRTSAESWVAIRVLCESTHPAVRLPPAKKPVLVRLLLESMGGAADGILPVRGQVHKLENVDIDLAARLIRGRAGCRLPVVYVSAGFRTEAAVDCEKLASDLSGMAHVVLEPNRAFSLRLKQEVQSQNVYGGTVGVYWPDGAGRRSFFIGSEFESSAELHSALVEEVRSALTNRRPLEQCTWAAVQSVVSRAAIDSLKASGSLELDKYSIEFDKEIEAAKQKLSDAEKEIGRLKAEIKKHEARTAPTSGLGLAVGDEQDFYQGEIQDIVVSALRDASTRVVADSRRQHVLRAIVATNPIGGEAEKLRGRLKEILRGSTGLDGRQRRDLEDIGFVIS